MSDQEFQLHVLKELKELKKSSLKKPTLKYIGELAAIVGVIVTCFTFFSSKIEHKMDTYFESKFEEVIHSKEYQKETCDLIIRYTVNDSELKKEFINLIEEQIKITNLRRDLIFLGDIWESYLMKEIDKQITKIEKDKNDIKKEDLRFIVDNWRYVRNKPTSYDIKVRSLENFLIK